MAADDEDQRRTTLGAPTLQPPRERGAAYVVAALVQDRRDSPFRNYVRDSDRFFQHTSGSVAGAAFPDLHDVERLQAGAAAGEGRALAIALGKVPLGALLQAADGCDHDPHENQESVIRGQ